jgi:hypothetical protein
MLNVEVDTDDLMKWARYMTMIQPKTGKAISNALNVVGEAAARNAVAFIADETGLDPEDVASLIVIKESTPDDLTWVMDASQVSGSDSSTPWAKRDDSASPFMQNTLVRLTNSADSKVCEKCLEACANSPYTLEEINNLNPYGNGYVHPNCRCNIQSWQATRQLPARVSSFGGSGPPELYSMRQLGQAIAAELEVVIKATLPT